MKKVNLIPTPAEYSYSDNFVPFKIAGAKVVGQTGEGLDHALSLVADGIKKADDGNILIFVGYDNFPQDIKEKTKELFEKKHAKLQGYYLSKTGDEIIIAAYAECGAMYGLMTLDQLFYEKTLPECFEIKDSPDFRGRGVKWLLWAETGIWSYDRGDGMEAFIERTKRKLDQCLRYKINGIVFNNYGFESERFPGYNNLMKTLNRESRKRGITLSNGGYGMGYGLVGQGKGVLRTEIHMNRKSYPDGEIYPCIGTYIDGCPEDEINGREYGTCLSNEALMECKLKEILEFIKNTEPSSISFHSMDADDILPPLWKARCEDCRKKWPNDDLFAEDGCAGAFADFIIKLREGMNRYVSEDGSYVAARDLGMGIAGPGYLYMGKRDKNVQNVLKFWQKISELIPDYKNFSVGFRENFFNVDTGEIILDKLREGWKNGDFSAGLFCGGDGFYSDKLFVPGGLFCCLMTGASSISITNGNGNQEALQLFNAEYMWNSANSAYYNIPNMPDNHEDFVPVYIDYLKGNIRPEEIYGDEGFLQIICEKLYGKEAAADFREIYTIRGEDGEPPLTSPCSCEIYTNFSRVSYPMRWDNAELPEDATEDELSINKILKKFIQIDISTKKAKELSAKIYKEKKYLPEVEEDVKWMADNFAVCEHFMDMLVRYMQCYKKVNAYFTKGEEISEETKDVLGALKKEADEFMAELEAMGLEAIDYLGGALVRRDEMADFLSYNSEIMMRSITEDKRLPSNLRPVKTRTHW